MTEVSKEGEKAALVKVSGSTQETRNALYLAFARLRHGNPKIVPKGTRITPTSVAAEAGVRRETLYKFHDPVLTEIQKHIRKEPQDKVRKLREEAAELKASTKELRAIAEDAQKSEAALARINHRLAARVKELEQLLLIRDRTISDLRSLKNSLPSENVVTMPTRR